MQHRETFIRRHGKLVLAGLVPTIANVRPMSIDIRERASNSDEALPNIGLDDETAEAYKSLGKEFATIIEDLREDVASRSFSSKFGSALGKTTKEDSTVDQRQCIELSIEMLSCRLLS